MLAALNPIQNWASIGPILDQLCPLMACFIDGRIKQVNDQF